ncbi:MAG: hypothetical protein MUO54_10000, partial [Anaerolineales bacterium]|nr:hypothetical protein [Anaerolineales bacterium]
MSTRNYLKHTESSWHLSSFWKFLLAGMMLALTSLSCNLPLDFLQSGRSERNAEELAVWGLDELDISESGDQVMVVYDQGADDDPEVMVIGWLLALEAAAAEAPDASEIILLTSFDGEPFLEITADADELRALIDGDLDQEAFLEGLEILDLRSLESQIFGRLVDQSLDVTSTSLSGRNLVIEYYPAPAKDSAALMDEWLEIFGVVFEENFALETIQIRALMLDTSVFVVDGTMEDIRAFYGGELTAFQFLASVS